MLMKEFRGRMADSRRAINHVKGDQQIVLLQIEADLDGI